MFSNMKLMQKIIIILFKKKSSIHKHSINWITEPDNWIELHNS